MDVFTGQMTPEVLASCKEYNICVENVPANMTKYYQPLDLTVNRESNIFLKENLWIGILNKSQINSVRV